MSLTPEDRRVITFYSFKGGVGRTMLMANIAYRMANKHGLRVIAVDWDLEAPGLHRFFGVSSEDVARKDGVLDYFEAWRGAVQAQAAEPPDISPSIIPITDEKHAPKFGSLSVLTAGRMDEGYAGRLAGLDWKKFYETDGGASAVETLREQLIDMADVVLIDSRTGFTDSGSVCTFQLPDGVVLVTSPNQQSLEGVDRVARMIVGTKRESRDGRGTPRLWFVTSRIPLVEETYLAEQWFARNEAWFEAGKRDGLWRTDDHPEGLRSHGIPHRGRWGFDEVIVKEATGGDPHDLLASPYDRFAETLLRWLRGEAPMGASELRGTPQRKPDYRDLAALETYIADAERRGDIHGMAVGLTKLAVGLVTAERTEEAVRKVEQACGIFLSRGAREEHARALYVLGWTLHNRRRYEEAAQVLTKALAEAGDLGLRELAAHLLVMLARTTWELGHPDAARALIRTCYEIARGLDESRVNLLMWLVGDSSVLLEDALLAVEALRRALRVARSQGETDHEKSALVSLIGLSNRGENIEDIGELRARLAELTTPSSSSADAPPAKPKRKTRAR